MLIGALIEVTFLIAGGVAAHHGLLHLPGIICLAVAGNLIQDHVFFLIGRFSKFEVLYGTIKRNCHPIS